MGLCDVLNSEMMCCELRGAHVTVKPLRRPFQCPVRPWDARHKNTTESPCHSTTTPYYKELLCITTFYSGISPYYKLLLQYPVYKILPNTTKYYSGTTPYYKGLLQHTPLQSTTLALLRTTKYSSVLQGNSPVLLRTTKYPYYKVLLRYCSVLLRHYSVLQNTSSYHKVITTSVLLRSTKYFSARQSQH